MPRLEVIPIVRRIASEPLLQFLVLGLALFGLSHLLETRDARPEIVVDEAQAAYQRNLFRGQFGVNPDAARLHELVDTYVRDESLYREALRLKLDQDDEIIRRRLVQKMEFLLAEGAAMPAPTDAELAAYHARHAADFSRPATVTFEQRYFADAQGAGPSGRARADAALRAAMRGAPVGGDAFAAGDRFSGTDAAEARSLFGDTPLTASLFSAPVGRWSGPYQSGYGWHLVRVTARSAAAVAPLAEVEGAVRDAWTRETRERETAARIAAVTQRYRVRRADGRPAP